MKSPILPLLAGLMLITGTACEKNETLFATTPQRLEGKWRFEKVRFTPNLSFNTTDLTADFADYVLTFNADMSLQRTNVANGLTQNGAWRVDNEFLYVGEDSYQNTEVLNATLVDFTSQNVELLYWSNLSVSRKKITANEHRDGGNYRYTLVRK